MRTSSKILFILTFICTTIIFLLVIFRYELRPWKIIDGGSTEFIILFLILFLVEFLLVVFLFASLKIKGILIPFIAIGSIVLITYLLQLFDNNKRKEEVVAFLDKNEKNLIRLVELYKQDEAGKFEFTNTERIGLADSLHVFITRNYEYNNKNHDDFVMINMYRFFGYGDGVAYSDLPDLTEQHSYHMSPMVEWQKIKDNWYYFAYND